MRCIARHEPFDMWLPARHSNNNNSRKRERPVLGRLKPVAHVPGCVLHKLTQTCHYAVTLSVLRFLRVHQHQMFHWFSLESLSKVQKLSEAYIVAQSFEIEP